MKIYMILIISLIYSNLLAQEPDSLTIAKPDSINSFRSLGEDGANVQDFEMVEPEHSPTTAALFSAALPGLGQAYNGRYWKIPIVWGGLAAFGYFINWNNNQYQYFRRNLIYEIAKDPDFPNETNLSSATLKSARDSFRRNRDQLVLFGILFYLMNIADAYIDAHLMEFSVNQDLSVRVSPDIIPLGNGRLGPVGLSLKLKF